MKYLKIIGNKNSRITRIYNRKYPTCIILITQGTKKI